jgi:DNA-binding transcriptional LysR family regulator
MNKLDWDDIRYFLAAAHTGSLAAASRQLGSHQPTVGRRIDSLEKRLGIRLFQRH